MALAQQVTKWQVFQYLFFPQIMPRIHALAQSGFVNLAYLVAQVYASINLLPRTHPIFLPGNKKNLTLRYVIASAAQRLTFSRSHIDQIIVFAAILVGIVLLFLQFILFLGFMAMRPAFAQNTAPDSYGDFFAEADLKNDIAYRMLFTVFGVPDLFKPGAARSEYHVALHSLFQLYSIGILVIAVIIVCYFIFAVLAETAQTGVPFGKRYNHVWTPIRLVFALGLLIPVGYGLNSAQWITLYAAKFGSDFATKGWVLFNKEMDGAYLDKPEKRVGTPKVPDVKALPAFVMLALACDYAYEKTGLQMNISPQLLSRNPATNPAPPPEDDAYGEDDSRYKYDMVIRIGAKDPIKYNDEPDNIFPFCGEIIISKTDDEPGSKEMRDVYYQAFSNLYTDADLKKYAKSMVDKYMEIPDKTGTVGEDPPSDFRAVQIKKLEDEIRKGIDKAVKKQGSSPSWKNNIEDVQKYGWGGAGIWYNKIAQINGSLVTAINTVPQVRKMPSTMENIRREVIQQNQNTGDPYLSYAQSDDQPINSEDDVQAPIGKVLVDIYIYWVGEDRSQGDLSNQTKLTGNVVIDMINAVFGAQGLFAMCQNTDTHPLAQLSILGKGLVEASIRNIMGGVGFGIAQMIVPAQFGAFMGAASGMLFSIASITIVMGFMLFYVLPFMPFLYFFFAVSGWIKGLFEAMVGMPLWALSHLRIDGEGLPGSAGLDGYYLIFEIFIRPILIVFGLLASVVIFAAMVKVLNEIFQLVVQNLSGHDPNATTMCGVPTEGPKTTAEKNPMEFFRGPIDELFYTVLYAIVVYMIGMSCFKLIDLIPNNILRYMGSGANAFNDKAADPADGLMSRLSIGGSMVSGKVLGSAGDGGMIQSLTSGVGQGVSGLAEAVKPKGEAKPSGG